MTRSDNQTNETMCCKFDTFDNLHCFRMCSGDKGGRFHMNTCASVALKPMVRYKDFKKKTRVG